MRKEIEKDGQTVSNEYYGAPFGITDPLAWQPGFDRVVDEVLKTQAGRALGRGATKNELRKWVFFLL